MHFPAFSKTVLAGMISAMLIGQSKANSPEDTRNGLPDTLRVQGGLIAGTLSKTGDVHIFKGIPFAAPPIGRLRWKEPQPVVPWTGIRNCSSFSASPFQPKPVPFLMYTEEFLIPKEPISEDCLYLNVWSAASKAGEKRPVIVWIYGGGFATGGTAVPIYDGEAMARKGVIFVSINYRVGVFGFMAHPGLTQESAHHASGNYGLMDQIAALRWVKKNIAAFGGDPNNITIAGQSAGSMSVNCLVASPLCKGLFQRAIAESGASFLKLPMFSGNTLDKAEQEGTKLAQSLNVNTIADLRKISADELLKKGTNLRGPIVDGYVLPQSVQQIFAGNKQNVVDLMTGWNEDEGFLFGPPKKAADFKTQVMEAYPSRAEEILKVYPANDEEQAASSQLAYSRDLVFGTQNFTWANIQSQGGHSKVYVYRFARKMPAEGQLAKYGAFHTAEVPYAYHNLQMVNRPWQPVDFSLAELMSSYWVNFARTGIPGGKSLPEWPAYDTKQNMIMYLDEKPAARPLPGKERLELLSAAMQGK